MSKDIYFVAIPCTLMHDTSKLCFGWNFEPDDEDKSKCISSISPSLIEYKVYDACEHLVCPVCKWFYNPCTPNAIVIDSLNIYASGASKCHVSMYSITRLINSLGTLDNTYLHDIGQVKRLSAIDTYVLTQMLVSMGPPKRTSDKIAFTDTFNVLSFMQIWCNNPNISVIYFGDD